MLGYEAGQRYLDSAAEQFLEENTRKTFNVTLDADSNYCNVDFLKYVDDNHVLKRLSIDVAKQAYLPVHTVFLCGMGVFSSIACRKYKINYQYRDSLPIGIYVVAEQPSGTGKSRCLRTFSKPFFQAEKDYLKSISQRIAVLQSLSKDDIEDFEAAELKELLKYNTPDFFITDPTPAALEETLNKSHGFFSLVSSEQALFNTMLGFSYKDKDSTNNNDLLLNGFDGGHINSKRKGRAGYKGEVIGGAVMFAQSPSIENIIIASNGSGLSERFLMIAEQHLLGTRKFCQDHELDVKAYNDYARICASFAEDVLKNPLEYDELIALDICKQGHNFIGKYRENIEKYLSDGQKYSHIAIRGSVAKIDMQIMKIAANLHILSGNPGYVIDLNITKTAIQIANAMISVIIGLCKDKGMMGLTAEYRAVIEYMSKPGKGNVNINDLKNAVRDRVPFKHLPARKMAAVQSTLEAMAGDSLISIVASRVMLI